MNFSLYKRKRHVLYKSPILYNWQIDKETPENGMVTISNLKVIPRETLQNNIIWARTTNLKRSSFHLKGITKVLNLSRDYLKLIESWETKLEISHNGIGLFCLKSPIEKFQNKLLQNIRIINRLTNSKLNETRYKMNPLQNRDKKNDRKHASNALCLEAHHSNLMASNSLYQANNHCIPILSLSKRWRYQCQFPFLNGVNFSKWKVAQKQFLMCNKTDGKTTRKYFSSIRKVTSIHGNCSKCAKLELFHLTKLDRHVSTLKGNNREKLKHESSERKFRHGFNYARTYSLLCNKTSVVVKCNICGKTFTPFENVKKNFPKRLQYIFTNSELDVFEKVSSKKLKHIHNIMHLIKVTWNKMYTETKWINKHIIQSISRPLEYFQNYSLSRVNIDAHSNTTENDFERKKLKFWTIYVDTKNIVKSRCKQKNITYDSVRKFYLKGINSLQISKEDHKITTKRNSSTKNVNVDNKSNYKSVYIKNYKQTNSTYNETGFYLDDENNEIHRYIKDINSSRITYAYSEEAINEERYKIEMKSLYLPDYYLSDEEHKQHNQDERIYLGHVYGTHTQPYFESNYMHHRIVTNPSKSCGNHGRYPKHTGGLKSLINHPQQHAQQMPSFTSIGLRHRRDARQSSSTASHFAGDGFGNAAYFSGNRQLLELKLKKKHGMSKYMIPRKHFTVELWVKPEGGQNNHTVIIGLFDICYRDKPNKGWSIGIRTNEVGMEDDARIYFALKTENSMKSTILMADRSYSPNQWLHVSATYSGEKMKLYIDSALVAVSQEQNGDLFSASASSCKEILLGGKAYTKDKLYRGYVDQILIWDLALKHRDIVRNLFDLTIHLKKDKGLVFKEDFSHLHRWKTVLKRQPTLVFSDIEDQRYSIQLVAPNCGKTVCDDPNIIRSYTRHSELRQEKKIRYRIVNVVDDDNRNPKVTDNQVVTQHRALLAAFRPYNISWELEEVKIFNTSLNQKTVLLYCLPNEIGDRHCHQECRHTQTGDDGGDCDIPEIPCDSINLGNGRCDFECNRVYHNWDHGDCCQSPFKSPNSTCLDPNSPYRIYLGMDEYKRALNVSGSTHLNIYFASWSLKGLSTFPWEKHVYSSLGGTIVDTKSFGVPGKLDELIHEIGHNLGLWHVHHGVSEVKCNDPCRETEPSLELGDLCSDTSPTTQNVNCRDPDSTVRRCGMGPFKNTPYRNYMSYASGNCTDHFTPQQVARMHCYLDLVYQPWLTTMKPSPVPLVPKVVAATLTSVKLVWIPGLGENVYGPHSECNMCTEDGSLLQYASSARAPSDSKRKIHWKAEEAVGPPDAELCKASRLAWMQEDYGCSEKCYIEFGFKYHVIPQRISIWVVWEAAAGIKNVKFYFIDGTTDSLGQVKAFCDMPFTARLNYNNKVKKVRIYTNNRYVSIDAIQLVSTPGSTRVCNTCRPTKYQVIRNPKFPRPVYTSNTMFTDRSVKRDANYSYTIQVNIGNKKSTLTPPLHYHHGQPFCGNGRVESKLGEACDDGNVHNGDGCTFHCQVERFYRCKGTPSLCYRYDGDGVCEKDEEGSSLRDCGFFTPPGYQDQWPIYVSGNPNHPKLPECSEDVLIGVPSRFLECKNNADLSNVWQPCNLNLYPDYDYWVKVYFKRPVIAVAIIIYFGSDGRTYDSPEDKFIFIQLIDSNDRLTDVERKIGVNCDTNPVHIPVFHDLSKPFFKTKGLKLSLSSANIAIAGVSLRFSKNFDPVTPNNCGGGEFYNPRSQQCINQTCPPISCRPLVLKFAKISCTGQNESDICNISCLDGYEINHSLNKVVCADGHWQRSEEISCHPVECRQPSMMHATFSCPYGTSYKKKCIFTCIPPAQIKGTDRTIICQANGRWSMADAYCLIFCLSPLPWPHAQLMTRSCTHGMQQAGTRCRFRCKSGFHTEGLHTKRRSLHLTCQENGLWSGRKCIRVKCITIAPEFTRMYNCTEENYEGSKCTLICPGVRKIQRIKCLPKGIWSSTFKMCNFSKTSTCPLPLLFDTRLRKKNCHNRSVGSNCEITCNNQMFQPVLPHMNGTTFTSKNYVMKLTCTGILHWHPDPSIISCKQICQVALKDRWCDTANNRPFCAWDQGDCCPSTVEGGKIQLLSQTCSEKCACKDPNAIENTNRSK